MYFFSSILYSATLLTSILARGFHGSKAWDKVRWPKRVVRSAPTYKKIILKNFRVFNGYNLRGLETVVIDGDSIGTDVHNADEMIDEHGRVLLPGLIDSHMHVYLNGNLEEHSNYGVTMILNINYFNYTFCEELKQAVGLSSVITTGLPAIGPEGYHTMTTPITDSELVRSPSDAEEFVSWTVGNNSDFLKIVAEYGGPSLETQQALVQVAHERGIPAATHASFYEPFQQAIESKCDMIQHISSDAVVADKWIHTILKQNQVVVPTMTIFRYMSETLQLSSSYREPTPRINPFQLSRPMSRHYTRKE